MRKIDIEKRMRKIVKEYVKVVSILNGKKKGQCAMLLYKNKLKYNKGNTLGNEIRWKN